MAEDSKVDHHAKYKSNPFELLRPSWEGAKLNLKTYLLLILAAIGVFGGLALVTYGLFKVAPAVGVILGVAAFIYLVIYATPIPYRLTLAMAHHKKVGFNDIVKNPFSLGWKMFYTQLLAGLIIVGGFILLIVPGVIFSVWYSFVPYVVLEEGLTGMAALRRAKQLVANRFWDTAGASTLTSVFRVLNFIPFLGALVSTVIALVFVSVPALRYVQLKALKEHSDGKDIPTNGWNYAVIIGAIIIGGLSYNHSLNNLKNNSQPTQQTNPYYLEN